RWGSAQACPLPSSGRAPARPSVASSPLARFQPDPQPRPRPRPWGTATSRPPALRPTAASPRRRRRRSPTSRAIPTPPTWTPVSIVGSATTRPRTIRASISTALGSTANSMPASARASSGASAAAAPTASGSTTTISASRPSISPIAAIGNGTPTTCSSMLIPTTTAGTWPTTFASAPTSTSCSSAPASGRIRWRQGPSCPSGRGKIAGPGSDSREGARRGGWLGRREGADRSVARCHVRIRARPRTTPEVVSKMGYRPFPTISHGAWTPGQAPRRRTGVPACGFLRPLPDAPYRHAPLHRSMPAAGRRQPLEVRRYRIVVPRRRRLRLAPPDLAALRFVELLAQVQLQRVHRVQQFLVHLRHHLRIPREPAGIEIAGLRDQILNRPLRRGILRQRLPEVVQGFEILLDRPLRVRWVRPLLRRHRLPHDMRFPEIIAAVAVIVVAVAACRDLVPHRPITVAVARAAVLPGNAIADPAVRTVAPRAPALRPSAPGLAVTRLPATIAAAAVLRRLLAALLALLPRLPIAAQLPWLELLARRALAVRGTLPS